MIKCTPCGRVCCCAQCCVMVTWCFPTPYSTLGRNLLSCFRQMKQHKLSEVFNLLSDLTLLAGLSSQEPPYPFSGDRYESGREDCCGFLSQFRRQTYCQQTIPKRKILSHNYAVREFMQVSVASIAGYVFLTTKAMRLGIPTIPRHEVLHESLHSLKHTNFHCVILPLENINVSAVWRCCGNFKCYCLLIVWSVLDCMHVLAI